VLRTYVGTMSYVVGNGVREEAPGGSSSRVRKEGGSIRVFFRSSNSLGHPLSGKASPAPPSCRTAEP
jgi:hypothetical protein